jgi:hypothetical protein
MWCICRRVSLRIRRVPFDFDFEVCLIPLYFLLISISIAISLFFDLVNLIVACFDHSTKYLDSPLPSTLLLVFFGGASFIMRSIYVGLYASGHLQDVSAAAIVLIEIPWCVK